MYAVNVLADSVGPHGIRLTTVEATFPRAYLSELNTHRALSRNSESSRAIPPELQIKRVLAKPYVPEFAGRVKGMGVGGRLVGANGLRAKRAWLDARDAAVDAAERLLEIDTAKDQVNRLLEPFMWHTAIISATDWDNFLNLRDHKDAAPPMQTLARMIREVLACSFPRELEVGEWHLPFVGTAEYKLIHGGQSSEPGIYGAHVSAGRCARSSYSTHHNPETASESFARWQRLAASGHWSPAEHPARCMATDGKLGNFRGWAQLRKMYPGEAVFSG